MRPRTTRNMMAPVLNHLDFCDCDIRIALTPPQKPGFRAGANRPGFSKGSRLFLMVGNDTDGDRICSCRKGREASRKHRPPHSSEEEGRNCRGSCRREKRRKERRLQGLSDRTRNCQGQKERGESYKQQSRMESQGNGGQKLSGPPRTTFAEWRRLRGACRFRGTPEMTKPPFLPPVSGRFLLSICPVAQKMAATTSNMSARWASDD